eukprot:PITA_24056
MGAEGSSGTPSFNQVILQKQQQNIKEGVRIEGLNNRMQNNRKKNDKTPMMSNKTENTTEDRNTEKQNRAGTQDKTDAKSQPSENGDEGPKEYKEPKNKSKVQPEKEGESSANPNRTSVNSRTCKPKKKDSLRVTITDLEIQAYSKHMAEHDIICKFMGIWPSERTLCQWIRQQWNPKGDVQLHLGAKGFFTVVFTSLEDKDRVFEGGPYFLAAAGLYMRPWKPNFIPEKESFTQFPVWIRLFSLPIDYWGLNALKQIGDKLGTFVKASETTMQKIYTTYARICVELDVSGALHEGLWLEYRGGRRRQNTEQQRQEQLYQTKEQKCANRRRNTKGNTGKNYFSNPFEILDLETDSEEKKNTPNGEAGQEG